jgi:hypothetical protein
MAIDTAIQRFRFFFRMEGDIESLKDITIWEHQEQLGSEGCIPARVKLKIRSAKAFLWGRNNVREQ